MLIATNFKTRLIMSGIKGSTFGMGQEKSDLGMKRDLYQSSIKRPSTQSEQINLQCNMASISFISDEDDETDLK